MTKTQNMKAVRIHHYGGADVLRFENAPLETIELRFQTPFKVYMAWREPHAGRVIVYIEGENDNKIPVRPQEVNSCSLSSRPAS